MDNPADAKAMRPPRRASHSVRGQHLPAPRLTFAGKWALTRYLVLPFLAALLALDVLLYLLFRFGLDRCYGLWCLLP